jgi:mycothiol synthase
MLDIHPVAAEHRAAALELLFADQSPEERREQVDELLRGIGTGEFSGEGLLGAHREGRLAGAILAQAQPGRTAALWPPRVARREPDATADQLLATAVEWLESEQDVVMAQVLMPLAARDDEARLRGAGFVHLADLLYLVSLEIEFPATDVSGPLEFEPCPDPNDARLARLVESSYEQTLDCPLLNGVRSIADVLDGYRGYGVFNPKLWLIARHAGRDVGCLILADHPRHGNLELVYMGVVPECRGRGWGGALSCKAQWLARTLGRPRLVLAVDAANQPAIAAYVAAGFQAWDRRRAMVRLL